MSYDLMLMDAAGSVRARERAERVLASLQSVPRLARPCELCSGFAEPSGFDCDDVQELLNEDGDAAERFRSFCAAAGLSEQSARSDPRWAARFLDLERGVILATATLPGTDPEIAEAYAGLVDFARANGLRLWDPQAGSGIDLADPGVLPPGWA